MPYALNLTKRHNIPNVACNGGETITLRVIFLLPLTNGERNKHLDAWWDGVNFLHNSPYDAVFLILTQLG